MYADGACIIYFTKSETELRVMLQLDLMYVLRSWCVDNSLLVNEGKTKYMLFNENIELKYNDVTIEQANIFKYLCLKFNHSLKWNDHIDYIIKKIAPITGIIEMNQPVCTKEYFVS